MKPTAANFEYRGSVLVDYRIFRNYIRIESKQRGT
ncbi:YlcG family protein [Enterobacter hormaechei]|nr:YlcG family protein [Enterobacter hormaechei]MBJ6377767.1 YlcG family protein [Enterobacter hormaechei]HBL9085202.1 YlcG family protein [Enterobacter hormaechei]